MKIVTNIQNEDFKAFIQRRDKIRESIKDVLRNKATFLDFLTDHDFLFSIEQSPKLNSELQSGERLILFNFYVQLKFYRLEFPEVISSLFFQLTDYLKFPEDGFITQPYSVFSESQRIYSKRILFHDQFYSLLIQPNCKYFESIKFNMKNFRESVNNFYAQCTFYIDKELPTSEQIAKFKEIYAARDQLHSSFFNKTTLNTSPHHGNHLKDSDQEVHELIEKLMDPNSTDLDHLSLFLSNLYLHIPKRYSLYIHLFLFRLLERISQLMEDNAKKYANKDKAIFFQFIDLLQQKVFIIFGLLIEFMTPKTFNSDDIKNSSQLFSFLLINSSFFELNFWNHVNNVNFVVIMLDNLSDILENLGESNYLIDDYCKLVHIFRNKLLITQPIENYAYHIDLLLTRMNRNYKLYPLHELTHHKITSFYNN